MRTSISSQASDRDAPGCPLRFAVIGGCGRDARQIVPMLRELGSVVAIVDPLTTAVEVNCPGAVLCAELAQMPDELQPDCWVLAGPRHPHEDPTEGLLAARKPILKAKPFALSALQGRRLKHRALKAGTPVFTIAPRHANPIFRELPNAVRSIGHPYSFVYRFFLAGRGSSEAEPEEQALREIAFDLRYDAFDIIRRTFGMPKQVSASAIFHEETAHRQGLELCVMTQLVFDGEHPLIGTVILDRNREAPEERLEIFGTAGRLTATASELVVMNAKNECILRQANAFSDREIMSRQIAQFISNLNDLQAAEGDMSAHLATLDLVGRVHGALSI
jgi:predicted dehydrogenase